MADDWENDVPVVPVIVPSKKKWDDEDLDDEVKESWEDSGEEEDTTKKKAPGPIRNKIPREQRVAEREEKKKEAAKLGDAISESDDSDEDPIARKERLRKLELAADIQNAQDLFAGVAVTVNSVILGGKLCLARLAVLNGESIGDFGLHMHIPQCGTPGKIEAQDGGKIEAQDKRGLR
ncbi:translation initiation factor eIF3 subunit-domain-containing protein [Jimgerdemannia flammicorona]|uniref:Translation initiation factor eIF3 subunit-domain-containing protein n=1 Tax=Jimgerdemannia flammicorona TaxID=994334 RepID=A0A433QAE5_9FUNG|nr:translation initiation factor eIF3 subunit-domain-containing protein [Jimgerdemannia flammicorona]